MAPTKKIKKVKAYVKLNLPAGKATPAPPVGPALGQHGVPLMDFCKEFNARTNQLGDAIIPVVLTVYEDRSFEFLTKTPLTSYLNQINDPETFKSENKVGKITRAQLEEIAKVKMPDLNTKDIDMAVRIVASQAKSMGVEVIE